MIRRRFLLTGTGALALRAVARAGILRAPRQNRKLAFERAQMPAANVERVANNRMGAEHADLDALMDE